MPFTKHMRGLVCTGSLGKAGRRWPSGRTPTTDPDGHSSGSYRPRLGDVGGVIFLEYSIRPCQFLNHQEAVLPPFLC